jgi:hypothetical protein
MLGDAGRDAALSAGRLRGVGPQRSSTFPRRWSDNQEIGLFGRTS